MILKRKRRKNERGRESEIEEGERKIINLLNQKKEKVHTQI